MGFLTTLKHLPAKYTSLVCATTLLPSGVPFALYELMGVANYGATEVYGTGFLENIVC